MADRIVLLTRGDEERAQEIIGAFADETGLEPREIEGGAEFAVSPDRHDVEIVAALNEIDAGWPEHLKLGDPSAGR